MGVGKVPQQTEGPWERQPQGLSQGGKGGGGVNQKHIMLTFFRPSCITEKKIGHYASHKWGAITVT